MENEFTSYDISEYKRERPIREKKKQGDFLLKVISVQMILCIFFAVSAFIISKIDATKFLELKELYTSMCEKDMTPEEIKSVFKTVTDFIILPATEQNQEPVEDELDGQGGEDLKLPIEKTSFSPIMITYKFTKPLDGKITSKFGYRINPVTNKYGFHTGMDIAAKQGTNIASAYDGTIKKVGFSAGRGNYVIIEHAKAVETVYCHCSEILASEGAVIRSGETIAKVGTTGESTGPHLHFEIHINGVICNPMWLYEEK
ncbi:MAG: M23 family metallopeptidase [Oscillospiraceae bacterium]